MHAFRRLDVWHRSLRLVVSLDAATKSFPRSDRAVVASQLRKAALSIPSNIAEGCGHTSRGETLRYLRMASASASEVESHLEVAAALRYLNAMQREVLLGDIKAIQRMLYRLIQNLP